MRELLAHVTAAEIEVRLARMAHLRRVADAERRIVDAAMLVTEKRADGRIDWRAREELRRACNALRDMQE